MRHQLALLLLGSIWGASFLFLRLAEPEFGAVPLIAVRVSVGALVLCGMLAARGELHDLRGHARGFVIVGALNSAVPFTLYAWATGSLGAGVPSVLNATVPLFGALVGSLWLGERLSGRRALGLALGFAGVLILTWSRLFSGAGDTSALAVAAGLFAALLYAIAAHDTKRRLAGVPPLAIAAGSMVGASALLVPVALFVLPRELPSPRALAAALALGLVCTSLAYAIYFRLLEALGATRAITVTYLVPAFGLLWSYLFLDEPLTWRTLAGSTVVLCGTALILRSGRVSAAPTPEPLRTPCPNSPSHTAR